MYRTGDFIFKDVIDLSGKMLGFISDIVLNFDSKKVAGFVITPNNIFKKTLNVNIEDVINFTSIIVVTDVNKGKYLQFEDIKNMDVLDEKGELMGVVEDVLFDEGKFSIRALVLSTGFINNFIKGRKILLVDNLILGDKNLLYRGKNWKFEFFNLAHGSLKRK
ncbi:MAG TPA: photosystem reaction center subunit H [Clostridium sp.]|uniref:PRC-barrel domain-containing protein n=1 Tax=Clostridium lapidicellarium TaxID=3240931 RepID=A0ABV4DSJ8_9CLOT|nr:PRC-barrel domain-containing protein [uncultured Clostridium sp.]HBC97954.1 photosystem reaction center subunit H [Clostridium sp.]